MNILIVVTRGDLGGAQTSVLNLARWLSEQGHFVTVGFGDGTFLKDACIDAGIQTVQFHNLRRTYNPFKNFLFVQEIRKYVDLYDTDVVHFNSSNALLGAFGVKRSRRKPATIFTVRGLSMLDPEFEMMPAMRKVYIKIFRTLFRYIDAVVFVSRHNMQTGRAQRLVRKGYVIYNGISQKHLHLLERKKAREHLLSRIPDEHRLEDAFLIGSIGRLAYQKNYEFLITALPKILETHDRVQLLIIGDGPERARYERLIQKLRLEAAVHLVGPLEYAATYVHAFDLFVLPSRYEGMSITMLETVTAGVPILATSVAGNDEILDGDVRQLYTLNAFDEFHAKIDALITSPELRRDVSVHNRERAKAFDIERTGQRYETLYREILGI
jgi:glycosyltransferase involved in cell wall biosynthesis